ncbi:MAG: cysteine--tRNA ligase [Methylophilaceae bacterium]|nr:cysteine--tRNA ligase [Methylophilaceae bacterium]
MLKIYNSLAREKQDFIPIIAGKVNMYVCGMTVYDYCHLGHARVMVVFDMVSRWLRASGYEVTYVRNITDIDDKIIKRALENQETIGTLTQRFIDAMNEDAAKLGVIRPNLEPRATEFVEGMVHMISTLVSKGFAYAADNGDVYYSVKSFDGYGKLSGKSLEDLRAGERVDIDLHKRDPLDFVLWKAAKPDEPSWDSPWGKGRPGWHIECSVMGEHHLGNHFDIHGGGQDLQFPHHENEIAQSEAAHGCTYVNYWMHNGFIRVINEKDGQDEKMSKSLGNFFTIRDVLRKYEAEVVRFFILRAQYRSPLNYSEHHLDDAKQALTRLYTTLKNVPPAAVAIDWSAPYAARFKAAMEDDFNTPEALAVLFDLANEANKTKSPELAGQLKALAAIVGLLEHDATGFLQGRLADEMSDANADTHALSPADIETLIQARLTAKQTKNYAEADRIRKELLENGIILEDTPQGTTWRSA